MRPLCHALILVAVQASCVAMAVAQDSSSNSPPGGSPTEQPPPGAHTPYENQPGGSIIGSRPGSMRPRVPINKRQQVPQATPGLPAPLRPQVPARPVYVPNAWSLLFEVEDEGPAGGLTLEQAIDRLVHASIALRAKSLDIPQARADVLTAGMHANPVVYFDGQLIPYKPYNSVTNPGGPTQYDLNVAYPVDLSGKRQARVEVACTAQRVTEALYQDAVRQEIDRLGSAYVDALAARLALRTTKSGSGEDRRNPQAIGADKSGIPATPKRSGARSKSSDRRLPWR